MKRAGRALRTRIAAATAGALTLACSERAEVGYDFPGGGAAAGGSAPGGAPSVMGGSAGAAENPAGGTGGGVAGPCEPVECRGRTYECGDCRDDDGDGLIDALDPECLGPCDDDEGSFWPGESSDQSCRLDCGFDRDAGVGNDRCTWDLRCDARSPGTDVGCASTEQTRMAESCSLTFAEQSETCVEACAPLAPNGCDCFGCCELPARGNRFVWLGGAGCSTATLDDPEACPPCTPVPACENRCDACEICVGGAGPSTACAEPDQPVCGPGVPPCGPGASCPSDRYCVTGCCIFVPT